MRSTAVPGYSLSTVMLLLLLASVESEAVRTFRVTSPLGETLIKAAADAFDALRAKAVLDSEATEKRRLRRIDRIEEAARELYLDFFTMGTDGVVMMKLQDLKKKNPKQRESSSS